MFTLARELSAFGTGVISGGAGKVGNGQMVTLPVVGPVGYDVLAEVATLALGAGLQAFAPATYPNIADGLTDGSLALVGRRVTMALTQQTGAWAYNAGYRRVNGASYSEVANGAAGQTLFHKTGPVASLT